MDLHFLEWQQPLTKRFARNADGTIEKFPYPNARNFTSHSETVTDVKDFFVALAAHAELGHCLLKGRLSKQIRNEPRAGLTDSMAHTQWVVFDLDNLQGFDKPETFIQAVLPPEFHRVSCIVQYSASQGITSDLGLRCHLFFILENTVSPPVLKNWLTWLNLTNPLLNNGLSLTATGRSLRFPLDRTVCQNDKLIFIAPPECEGFTDPLAGKRLRLIERELPRVPFIPPFHTDAELQAMQQSRIAELRKASGLPATQQKIKYSDALNEFILENPEQATVTGVREARGFVYLNLNGGDSWGYYFPTDRPEYLYNFKDEPVVPLAKIAPDFYRQYQDTLKQSQPSQRTVFVFREPTGDCYWAGIWDVARERMLQINQIGSRDRIADFFAYHNGGSVPDPIPDWRYEFEPDNPVLFDPQNGFVNRWEPTDILRTAKPVDEIPPVTLRILRSVTGDDDEALQRFVNWLACIVQYRTKIGTAWVLHGVQGTGKGLLFHEILRPILGHKHCFIKQLHDFNDQFNDFQETALLVDIDEARVDNNRAATKLVNQLKNMITEPVIDVRGMYQKRRQVRSFANFLITSNDYDSMRIERGDRRFNVAPRQEKRLEISTSEVDQLRNEIDAFAGFLRYCTADLDLARTTIENSAKEAMREAALDSIDQLLEAVLRGDLAYFLDLAEYGPGNTESDWAHWQAFEKALKRWLPFANRAETCVVTSKELLAAFSYATGKSMGGKSFDRLLMHRNFPKRKRFWDSGQKKQERGWAINWTCPADDLFNRDIPGINLGAAPRDQSTVVQLPKFATTEE